MNVQRTAIDWMLEGLSLALLAFAVLYPLLQWDQIPDWIPVHFGISGAPDRWGSKSQLWLISGAAVLLYAVMTVVLRFPRFINLPFSVDRDSPEVQRLLIRLLGVLKTSTVALMAYLTWASIQVAWGKMSGLSPLLLPYVLLGSIGPVILFLLLLWRQRKSSRE